jgi:hypothetical protein
MEQVATKRKEKAEEIINSVLNKEPIVDESIIDEPESFDVRVIRLARNKKFVYGVLDGMLIEIFLPRRRENSINRCITVVRAPEIGENKFKVLQ